MSVSSINGSDPSQQAQLTQQAQQAQQIQQMQALLGIQGSDANSTPSAMSTSLTFPSTTDQANFSKAGQMMNQLSQLQKNNPSEFASVTQQISQELNTQAQNCNDPREAQRLTSFSAQFAQAAQTGSMAPLAQGQQAGQGQRTKGGFRGGAMGAVFGDVSRSLASVSSNAGAIGSNAGVAGGLLGALENIVAGDLSALASNAGLSGSATPGQMLAQLQANNPAEFKAVTAKISQDLAAQAQSNTDPLQSQVMSDISRKFADASQTGSMASLEPSRHERREFHKLRELEAMAAKQTQTGDDGLSSLLAQSASSASNSTTSGIDASNWSVLQGLGSGTNSSYNNQGMGAILGSAVLS
ncbi:MAG: hypothetical protein HQK81_13930 [Desulfovibrionaceae bacterium]|nr:hypothetical protein [Desulfovibrionaceae bacterium]MBF0515143.1 hypothetical protein [Desulfovibrionaceae bacterium]